MGVGGGGGGGGANGASFQSPVTNVRYAGAKYSMNYEPSLHSKKQNQSQLMRKWIGSEIYIENKIPAHEDEDDVGLHVLGCRVDILGTNCNACISLMN